MEYLINTWNKFLETNKNKGEQWWITISKNWT
jgi:hypothetical protein